jgi:hypothetical protein
MVENKRMVVNVHGIYPYINLVQKLGERKIFNENNNDNW